MALFGESCSGGSADLACCTEAEACDLVNSETLTCTDLPFFDNSGAPRTCKLLKLNILFQNYVQMFVVGDQITPILPQAPTRVLAIAPSIPQPATLLKQLM